METWEAHAQPQAPTSYSYHCFQFCLSCLGFGFGFFLYCRWFETEKKCKFSFNQPLLKTKIFQQIAEYTRTEEFDSDTHDQMEHSQLKKVHFILIAFYCLLYNWY